MVRSATSDHAAEVLDADELGDGITGFSRLVRDRNNVERGYRQVRTGTPFEWVVPHTYRKTVATFLDHGG